MDDYPVCLIDLLPLDPAIRAEVEDWKRKLSNFSAEFIGTTLVYLNGTFEECRFRECNLGNLICDAMVSAWPLHVSAVFESLLGNISSISTQ